MKPGDKLIHQERGACEFVSAVSKESAIVKLANGIEIEASVSYLKPEPAPSK